MQIFSGRNTRLGSNSLLFASFVDKLFTREKVKQISEEILGIESILLSQVAKEAPELFRQIVAQQQRDTERATLDKDERESRTPFAVIE